MLNQNIIPTLVVLFNLLLITRCTIGEDVQSESKKNNTTVQIRNNTKDTIYQIFVYYDQENNSWTSSGHWKIAPYSDFSREIFASPNKPYKGRFYLKAMNSALNRGDLKYFCVDPTNAFEILNSDRIKCIDKAKFIRYYIKPGMNKMIINP
jgi:hypothetical protein